MHNNYPESKTSLLTFLAGSILISVQAQVTGGYYEHAGPNNSNYVHTRYSMYSPWFVVWDDHIYHIAHEYGHAVGQHHTYDSEITNVFHYDFLDDVFGLCPEPLMMDPNNPCFVNCGQPDKPCPCNPSPNNICYLRDGCFFPIFLNHTL